jgi:hypothetical protein
MTTFYCLRFKTPESESYITTDGQSARLFWNKVPAWGLRQDFCYCQTIAGLLMWGALSDERTGLSFKIAPGSRQQSHFWVWVPWGSWQYFSVSDSRLPFSSLSTTRRATVEAFDPASTREWLRDPQGQVPVFISPSNRVVRLYPQTLGYLCTDRVENTVSNSVSIVACVSVAAGTCLPSRCLVMEKLSQK